jgi:hypothetical protein
LLGFHAIFTTATTTSFDRFRFCVKYGIVS